MKAFYTILSLMIAGFMLPAAAISQNEWPKSFTNANGDLVKVYQLQPEAFSNGTLEANAAISVLKQGQSDPVFGMIWLNAGTVTRGQQVDLNTVQVTAIKLPNENDQDALTALQNNIAGSMNNWNISIPQNDINTALQLSRQETSLSSDLNNNPPKILYANKPSILVVIDGAPRLQNNSKWNVQTVVNTPFIILKDDNRFFLYGGRHWYTAPAATGPYSLTTNISGNLSRIQEEVAQANKDNNVQQEQKDYEISNIIVTTEPAELLQSDGEPNFTPVQGTNLLYVRNSDNDIFMDVSGQQYYVLLSGRWYRSSSLDGNWQFIGADRLPADFAKIPAGSPKDNVLASVAGTPAARDAVMDAQVPQTAKVDRKTATADIEYDGDPQFDNIAGTDMDYAINTSSYVLRWRGSYYAVDNGVWFESYSPAGPWRIATERPYAVSLIPPRYPVYAMKYVYIYDVTPDYIYMGYTPGYLNTFVYGPTVVYGTGYYYRPWYGRYYYPRPYTWGFNMHYSPWTGWGFGFNFNFGWFNFGIGNYSPWSYYGGWWGPAIYRPSYSWAPYRGGYHGGYYGGYYGRRNTVVINNNINIYRNNNIYNRRTGVIGTRDNRRVAAAYPRNASPLPSGRYGNARPVERGVSRNPGNYNNNRPTVGRNAQPGNASPRITPSEGRNPASSGSTRPTRTFDRLPQNNQTSPSQAASPSRRINNENTPQARPQPSGQNRNSGQQPARSFSNIDRQPRTIERTAPVQRNVQAARQPVQRVERSSAPTRSSGGAERAPRQAGGERRAGRG
ncbi:MAG: hypothetical protein J0H29_07670 [Sphingobacteriales bacterium]|nr:hypothetical protein [Sphingobacteriales bacterium]OJY81147.1 MAG: hypothetical protein BGP14_08015 [Sphingobacteriales bacterium 44-15]